MIRHSIQEGSVCIEVRVIPRSSKSEVVGEHDGALKVKLSSPPVDGAANEELVKLLARVLDVSRSDVEITAGHGSKNKKVRIAGIRIDRIDAILQSKT